LLVRWLLSVDPRMLGTTSLLAKTTTAGCCSEAFSLCILPYSAQSRARFITSVHAFLPLYFIPFGVFVGVSSSLARSVLFQLVPLLWRWNCGPLNLSTRTGVITTRGVSFLKANFQFRVAPENKSSVKMSVFWDVAPCSLVEFHRRFRGDGCS
jgi:hypothetical protein